VKTYDAVTGLASLAWLTVVPFIAVMLGPRRYRTQRRLGGSYVMLTLLLFAILIGVRLAIWGTRDLAL
jgi:hypothetical protein